jgi:myo-inositol-1(or 4)-monophosphatase
MKIPYKLVAEEKQLNLGLIGTDEGIIYIDPLEGTHNFTRKRKELGFGVTLGLVKNGCPVYVVFYNPVYNQIYRAIKNEGAYLNNKRIYVSDRKPGDKLDIIFNHWPDIEPVGKYLDKLRSGKEKITDYTLTSCSDAIDICMVARGSVDGLVFIYKGEEAQPWDLITALLIEEAGGKVTNIRGKPWYRVDKNGLKVKNSMVAGNLSVHEALLNLYTPNFK